MLSDTKRDHPPGYCQGHVAPCRINMPQVDSQNVRPIADLRPDQAASWRRLVRGSCASPDIGQSDPTLGSYVRRGGVACGDELVSLIRTHADQPISRVARWIVGREAVQFKYGHDTVFPLFQFDLAEMSIRSDVRRVLAELAAAFDDAEIAQWFVRPNAWLAGATPVDALQYGVDGVLEAARADRFLILG